MKEYSLKEETKTILEWSKDLRCLVSKEILRSRLKNGWSLEKALSEKAAYKGPAKLEGLRFGRLEVIKKENIKVKRGGTSWRCKCDCGNEKIVHIAHLGREIKSCGCLKKEILKKCSDSNRKELGEAAKLYYFKSYQNNATKNKLEWKLSLDQFVSLTKGYCYYCGQPPIKEIGKEKQYGKYQSNGIDRVDNFKGYILENCVTSCNYCNIAKKNLSQREFLEKIEKIYNNRILPFK